MAMYVKSEVLTVRPWRASAEIARGRTRPAPRRLATSLRGFA